MGDAGALFLGVLLAILTVRFEPDTQSQLLSYLTPIFLLAIPILDTTVAVSSRIRRHLSPFQGGQDHLSHRLIRAGLSRKAAAISLWGLSSLFAIISVLISQMSQYNTNNIAFTAVILWVILLILFFRTKDA
jgi:UDP-GlcNAc:undecaprenyl-phosphate GlcNAc-1-phosphate transferase